MFARVGLFFDWVKCPALLPRGYITAAITTAVSLTI